MAKDDADMGWSMTKRKPLCEWKLEDGRETLYCDGRLIGHIEPAENAHWVSVTAAGVHIKWPKRVHALGWLEWTSCTTTCPTQRLKCSP